MSLQNSFPISMINNKISRNMLNIFESNINKFVPGCFYLSVEFLGDLATLSLVYDNRTGCSCVAYHMSCHKRRK